MMPPVLATSVIRVVSRNWIVRNARHSRDLAAGKDRLYNRDLGAWKGRMGRTATTATAENSLPLQFLAA
jgi:hypothetical protein